MSADRVLSTPEAAALLAETGVLLNRTIVLTGRLGRSKNVQVHNCYFILRRSDPAPSMTDPEAFIEWLLGEEPENVAVTCNVFNGGDQP